MCLRNTHTETLAPITLHVATHTTVPNTLHTSQALLTPTLPADHLYFSSGWDSTPSKSPPYPQIKHSNPSLPAPWVPTIHPLFFLPAAHPNAVIPLPWKPCLLATHAHDARKYHPLQSHPDPKHPNRPYPSTLYGLPPTPHPPALSWATYPGSLPFTVASESFTPGPPHSLSISMPSTHGLSAPLPPPCRLSTPVSPSVGYLLTPHVEYPPKTYHQWAVHPNASTHNVHPAPQHHLGPHLLYF